MCRAFAKGCAAAPGQVWDNSGVANNQPRPPMNTTRRWLSLSRRIIPVIFGFCLAALITGINQARPLRPATAQSVALPASTFEQAKVDPQAAEDAGLWTIVKPTKAVKRIAFEDARIDPQAAENAKLWDIDATAGCGHTKKH